MSELRKDPVTGEWVIIATERARRPHEFARREAQPRVRNREDCPFCPGGEYKTPPEILVMPGEGPWRVRVVSNLYAAVSPSAEALGDTDGQYTWMAGVGAHEVVIETPDHDLDMGLMTDDQVRDVFWAYRERYRALREDPRYGMAMVFKNHGAPAGTSLEHPHSQIIALPVVPPQVQRRWDIAERYFEVNGTGLYEAVLRREIEAGERVVLASELFVGYHPYASVGPFEVRILPREQRASFGEATDEEVADVARVVRLSLSRIRGALNDPDYNLMVHSAPFGEEGARSFRWHVQVLPRLTVAAGFEIGTGVQINTASPEETAAYMRGLPES